MRRMTKIGAALATAALVITGAVALASGGAAVAAEEQAPPALVEDYSYPGAAALETSRQIKLISGDGRITLLKDCTGTEPKIQVETFAAGSEGVYCFAVKGDHGVLKLEVPNVYLLFAGDEALNAKYTVGGVADEVDIRAGGLEGIGASDPDSAVLLELRAGS
jgi:hypothetical protein